MRFGTRGVGARWRKRREEKSRGAVLVEFALIAPILFLLVFGIIEFGWAFLQYLDVRHGSREGGRLAAVNFQPDASTGADQRADILAAACDRMDSSTTVRIRFTQIDTDADLDTREIGDQVEVEVEADLDTLTGFFDWALGDVDLNSTVTLRSEQTQTWDSTASLEDCPP